MRGGRLCAGSSSTGRRRGEFSVGISSQGTSKTAWRLLVSGWFGAGGPGPTGGAGVDTRGREATAETAGDGPQTWPGGVAHEPVAGDAQVVWYGVLIRIGQALRHPPYGPRGRPVNRS